MRKLLGRFGLVLWAGTLLLGACAEGKRGPSKVAHNLAPLEFQRALAQPGVQLVDVRQTEEYAQGHLQGARLLPLDAWPGCLTELERSRPVLLYCRSGRRSARALELLLRNGYEAGHLAGGILAWEAAGLPLER
jgi:rhodanese-related sulfurtransferase